MDRRGVQSLLLPPRTLMRRQLILHPEPDKGGTMNNRVTYALYQHFQSRGFAVVRFNFRGVGRSQGTYEGGEGEFSDGDSHGLATVADTGFQPVLDCRLFRVLDRHAAYDAPA